MKQKYKKPKGPPLHNFGRNIVGKAYCCGCGLIRLNNEATDRAVARGCVDDADHLQEKKDVLA